MINWHKKLRLVILSGLLVALDGGFGVCILAVKQGLAQEATAEAGPVAEEDKAEDLATESEGLADLDEALRLKITSNGLRDLYQVIDRLEFALEKGLNAEDNEFAEQMLSDSLMERATTLMQVINTRSLQDQQLRKIRAQASSDLRRVLGYKDPLPSAYLMFSKLMALQGGDPHEARRAIGDYLKLEELPNEQRAEALVLRARLSKDEKKSLADMEAAIQLAPENSAYRLAKSMFLRRANKLDEALAAIDELLELNPENGNAIINQGEIYRQQNRLEEALASFDKATELAPLAPGPFQNRGEIYRQQGDFEKSISQFNEVLKLQPGVLLTLLHRAEAYMGKGDLKQALADIDNVLEKHKLVSAHRLRSEILAKMNRLDEAIEEMERVSAAMPDQPDLKIQLALYYQAGKKPAKAIAILSDVLNQNKENFSVLQIRGNLYLNIGKHAEAITDFTQALKLQPEDTPLLNNLAWVLATSPEESLRDGKRAVELASKACEITDYKTPHILSTLAAAFAENGNFETAIKWSQQAVDFEDPEHGDQIVKELNSYREGKPWREKQNVSEEAVPEPLEESLQGPGPGPERIRF